MYLVYAETSILSGAVVFETRLGQRFDVIYSLVTMPWGFALFEGCWLSHVAPCFLSMIEAGLREDETEWDIEVNEDFHFLEVIFTTSWIIQQLSALADTQTHTDSVSTTMQLHCNHQREMIPFQNQDFSFS